MMWDMHDGMGWWMLWGSVFWVLFFVGLAVLVAWLFANTSRSSGRDPALDILRERYARGEIDRDEFEQKRRELER